MTEPGEGVLFAPQDHAGLFRRFFIVAVDGSVVLGAAVALAFLHDAFPDQIWADPDVLTWTWIALVWGYLVPVEAWVGTVGFLLAGVRISTLTGGRPSLGTMTFRLLLWIFGPLNALVDFIYLGGDPYKQTLRDKLAGTLVVRRGASPVGRGRVRLKRITLLGFVSLAAWEVDPATQGAGT